MELKNKMKENFSISEFNTSKSISTFSQSQASFFIHKPLFLDHPLLEKCFKENSYEIMQFLDKDDIDKLKLVNKFFNNLCECHSLFNDSINSLNNLFNMTINDKVEPMKKGSKLREKYNFNKPMEQYYKNSKVYKERIQSGMRRKKK
jgi:uncharacterized protein YdcH (DUF465 family)